METIAYNGQPQTAIHQYQLNKQIAAGIDKANAQLSTAQKVLPDEAKKLGFIKDVLTCLKSDADRVVTFQKLLIKLGSENPIGKAIFGMYEAGFEVMFNAIFVTQRISDLRLILNVFMDFLSEAANTEKSLPVWNNREFATGPISFLIKKTSNGVQLDSDTFCRVGKLLFHEGKQIVALYDGFLTTLVPNIRAMNTFITGLENPKVKTMLDKIGNDVSDRDLEDFQFNISRANLTSIDNSVLGKRNVWAKWVDIHTNKPETYK